MTIRSAFPNNTANVCKDGACFPDPGMSMLDYFATAALPAVLLQARMESLETPDLRTVDWVAQECYDIATAMVAESNNRHGKVMAHDPDGNITTTGGTP